jgi:hypothetical protein
MMRMTLQVFTAVFVAEPLRPDVDGVEPVNRPERNQPGAVEFKQTLRECVSKLESRGFFAWDEPNQD